MKLDYTFIVAIDHFWGISKDGEIPWNYPEDFQHFKNITMGKHCIMGRKTYEDILARSKTGMVLPGRTPWVISSTMDMDTPGVGVLRYPTEIEDHVPEGTEIMILGGEAIYQHMLTLAMTAYVTHIAPSYQCDKFFPFPYIEQAFRLVESVPGKHPDLKFNKYIRRHEF